MGNLAEIKNTIWETTKKADFKKKSGGWFRDTKETVQVIYLQKSQYGNQYYLNFGIALKHLGAGSFPKENQCHIRFRLTALFSGEMEKMASETLDFESEKITDVQRKNNIITLLEKTALPFLSELSSMRGIKDAVENGKLSRALVHRNVKD